MSSTTAPSDPRTPSFHEYHNRGDIPFLASDGTILMAESWRLARVGGFFADMLELPPPRPKHPTSNPSAFTREDIPGALCDPIPTDTAAPVLDLFLNYSNVSEPSLIVKVLGWDETRALYLFCRRFQITDVIAGPVNTRLSALTAERPWDLLLWAGELEDVALARRALANMTGAVFTRQGHASLRFWGALGNLPAALGEGGGGKENRETVEEGGGKESRRTVEGGAGSKES
ncbi:hypothetical protein IAT38_002451 [Cryptococcus sp. DSM 104549]